MSSSDVQSSVAKIKKWGARATNATIVLIAFGFTGWISEGYFLPSYGVVTFGLALAVALTILLVVLALFLLVRVLRKKSPRPPLGRIVVALLGLSLCVVLLPGLLIPLFAPLGFYGLANLDTKLFGQPAVRQVAVIEWRPATHSRHYSTCAGIVVANNPGPRELLCFSGRVAAGTILTLHGRQSVFGFHVDSID